MEIFFSIISIIALVFCTVVIIDKAVFTRQVQAMSLGMTGREAQEASGLVLRIQEIEGSSYRAIVVSKTTLFKYTLYFQNAKLTSIMRD